MSTNLTSRNQKISLKKSKSKQLTYVNRSLKPLQDLVSSPENSQLTSNKIFLNRLLNIIQLFQLHFLPNKSNSKTNIQKNKILLGNFKNELLNIFNENKLIKSKLQNKIQLKRKILQKQIFGEDEVLNNEHENCNNTIKLKNNLSNYEIEAKSEINKKSKTPKTLKTKKILNQQLGIDFSFKKHTELHYLKLLNFKIENQISAIDNILFQKNQQLDLIKNADRSSTNFNIINCVNKVNLTNAFEIHNENLLKNQKILTEKTSEKNQIKSEIAKIQSKKEEIEKTLSNLAIKDTGKYIDINENTNEESFEYSKCCMSSQNKMYIKRKSISKHKVNNIININKKNNIINIDLNTNKLSKDNENDKISELNNDFILSGNNISEIKSYE